MTKLKDPTEVRSLLKDLGAEKVIVISPHLDDAVFSIAGFLSVIGDRARVVTVFTEGVIGRNSAWAQATGFADSVAEHKIRRLEDVSAMNRLGCGYQHLGFRPGDANERSVAQAVRTMAQCHPAGLTHTLVLLPAGAGGPTPSTPFSRLAQRLMRRPWGCAPHGEHELTRDLFWQALTNSGGAQLGFYAEVPYAWSHDNTALQKRLHSAIGCKTRLVEYRHDTSEKLRMAELYQSQFTAIFGPNPTYRRRALAREECLLLA